MNKKRVNNMIITAKDILLDTGIAHLKDSKKPHSDDNPYVIQKTFRGNIATFGAAVVTGSLKSAIAFFSQQGGSDVERPKLIEAMFRCIMITEGKTVPEKTTASSILGMICSCDSIKLREWTEKFIDASIALKLAMNFYTLVKENDDNDKSESSVQ